jgi:hypothetical protein
MVFGGGTGINAVGPKIFIWPLLCCFLAAAYVYYCCPETTGKTLEELDMLFARSQTTKDRIQQEQIDRRASYTSISDEKRRASNASRRRGSALSVERTEHANAKV